VIIIVPPYFLSTGNRKARDITGLWFAEMYSR
jgi:hypothetical protein